MSNCYQKMCVSMAQDGGVFLGLMSRNVGPAHRDGHLELGKKDISDIIIGKGTRKTP